MFTWIIPHIPDSQLQVGTIREGTAPRHENDTIVKDTAVWTIQKSQSL